MKKKFLLSEKSWAIVRKVEEDKVREREELPPYMIDEVEYPEHWGFDKQEDENEIS